MNQPAPRQKNMARISFILSFLLLYFLSPLKAQVFSPESAHAKNDPIEVQKKKYVHDLFSDRRFAAGFLLQSSFYINMPFSAGSSLQNTVNQPETSKRLLQYYFRKVDELSDATAEAYFDRGSARLDSTLYEKAMNDFDQVLLYDPRNADAFVNRGVLFIISEQFSEALEELDKAERISPKNPDVFFNKGVVAFNQGNPDLALKQLDRALSFNPDHSRAHFEKGLVFSSIGDNESALPELRLARGLGDPDAGKLIREIKEKQKKKK